MDKKSTDINDSKAKDTAAKDRVRASGKPSGVAPAQSRLKLRLPPANFVTVGALIAGLLALAIVTLYGTAVYQLDFWKFYFFHDSVEIGDRCEHRIAHAEGSDFPVEALASQPWQPLGLPHSGRSVLNGGLQPGRTAFVEYRCTVDASALREADGEGLGYIHLGWVYGERTSVLVNGVEHASLTGSDKVSLAVTRADLEGSELVVTLRTQTKSDPLVGLNGQSPIVLSVGSQKNSKILGLSIALQQTKGLFNILPVLTMSTFIIFGWMTGFRSRIVIVTLLYFLMVAARNMLMFLVDFWPWDVARTYLLFRAFDLPVYMAFLLFGMELLKVGGRWFNAVFAATFVVLLVEFSIILAIDNAYYWTQQFEKLHMAVIFPWSVMLLRAGLRELGGLASTDRARYYANRAFLFALAAYPTVLLSDFAMRFISVPLGLNYRMDIVMPLFVGGLMLYTLAQIEKRLKIEREQRMKMEGDLALAARLQGVLLPKDLAGEACGMHYEIDSKPLGILGGDWVKIHAHDGRALFILGDVVGKGPSAALTHSGIAAAWETQVRLWQKGMVTAEDLLTELNNTMFDLFQGQMNTTFAACEVQRDKVRVAAGGNHWLHLNPTRSRPSCQPSRALIGVARELVVSFQTVEMVEGDWLVTFTDGVLEGNRPLKRFLQSVQPEVSELTGEIIRKRLVDAGSGAVHADDASSLILRLGQPTGAGAKPPVAA